MKLLWEIKLWFFACSCVFAIFQVLQKAHLLMFWQRRLAVQAEETGDRVRLQISRLRCSGHLIVSKNDKKHRLQRLNYYHFSQMTGWTPSNFELITQVWYCTEDEKYCKFCFYHYEYMGEAFHALHPLVHINYDIKTKKQHLADVTPCSWPVRGHVGRNENANGRRLRRGIMSHESRCLKGTWRLNLKNTKF